MLVKRLFDIVFSFCLLFFLSWLIVITLIIATIDTKSFGIFCQTRVGQYGKCFTIYKLKTVRPATNSVTILGQFFRDSKLNELPQLFNVLKGDMSMVGPRPDVPGYYDSLMGVDKELLKLKPGITGPASIKYANEEKILAAQTNPLKYNDEVIFPDKLRINHIYQKHQSLKLDLQILFCTILKNDLCRKLTVFFNK